MTLIMIIPSLGDCISSELVSRLNKDELENAYA